TNIPYRQGNVRRRKDDTRVGTAVRRNVERLSCFPRRLHADGGSSKYSAQEIRSGFDMNKVLTYDNPPHLCLIRRTVLMPGPLPKYPVQLTPEQEAHLQHLSTCYTAPYAEVQRARILLLAHQQPTWRNAEIARQVGGCVQTVKHWRQRWPQTASVR